MLETTCKPTNMEYGNKLRNSRTHMTAAALLDEARENLRRNATMERMKGEHQLQIYQYIQVYFRIPLVFMPQTHHMTSPGSLIQGQLIP